MGWSKIIFNASFEEGREGYQMLITGSKILIVAKIITVSSLQNTYNYIAVARFNCNYLEILNSEAKILPPPTFSEIKSSYLAVILLASFFTDLLL